jgi:alpha-D-ribose 1-methylphosphonate 5-triphosphate synthase subunit PhnG
MLKREELNFFLQKTDFNDLKNFYDKIKNIHEIKILQGPTQQTLLQPVYDPISEGEFYIGEILVTTTLVMVDEFKGWAMVMDYDEEQSLYIAIMDACFGGGLYKDEIVLLVNKTKEKIEKKKKELNKKIHSTKVNFDLM